MKKYRMRKRRCPWCGAEVFMLSVYSSTKAKCDSCGHYYTYCSDSKAGKIQKLSFALLILCMFIVPFDYLPSIAVFFLFLYVICYLFIPYERMDDTDKFTIRRYVAKINLYDNIRLNPRKILSSHNIVPVCFVNDENIPVSNDICILIEEAEKIANNEYECIFSFLPQSGVKFDINEPDVKFIIFDDHVKAGEGIVTCEKDGF